jgi:formylglycine-generating enzyme required for sulfatase activity
MVYIPAGEFMLGSDNHASDERPVTRVSHPRPFLLGKYEVTQGQYEVVMEANPSVFKQVGANAPVEGVSWNDAMAFCRKLTTRERAAGRLPADCEYTLPTEAQWEYACRAGTTGDYAGDLDEMAWYAGNSGRTTHAVGTKKPNAWGLYDMHGNVWEWCLDWRGDYPGGSVTDPTGPLSGGRRVGRGGCWGNRADNCRSAFRGGSRPGVRGGHLGFRLALSAVGGQGK